MPWRDAPRFDARAKSNDRIRTATDFVTLVDFIDVADMAVFLDEAAAFDAREAHEIARLYGS